MNGDRMPALESQLDIAILGERLSQSHCMIHIDNLRKRERRSQDSRQARLSAYFGMKMGLPARHTFKFKIVPITRPSLSTHFCLHNLIGHMDAPWDSVYSHAEAFLQSHNRRDDSSHYPSAPQSQQQQPSNNSLHHAKQLLHSLRAAALDSALLAVAAAEKTAPSVLGLGLRGTETADRTALAATSSSMEGEEGKGGSKGSKAAAVVL